MNKEQTLFSKIQSMNFFMIYDTIIGEWNNDSVLTPENWNDRKQVFFNQRIESYKDSYSINDRIGQELKHLEKLEFTRQDNEILRTRYIQYLNDKLEKPQQDNNDEPYQNKDWFVVGILFATGEMDDLLKQYDRNASRIARHLNRPNLRPCITDSISSHSSSTKSIFKNRTKMLKIIEHCEKNGIIVTPSFKDRLPTE